MTLEEQVLKVIEEHQKEAGVAFLGWVQFTVEELTAVKTALEKQILKRPTHEASLYKSLTCPTCKNVIDEFMEFIPEQPKIRVKTLHCKFCGQALDWGDSE